MARPRRPKLTPRLAEYRARFGLTQEQVAEAVGITAEMVRRHEKGQSQPIELYRKRYGALYQATQGELGLLPHSENSLPPQEGIETLVAEVLGSDTSDGAIDQLARAVDSLAESHTQAPARRILAEGLRLHRQVSALVTGKQRLGQRRELFRIESALLAHLCILLDDVKRNETAQAYGAAALSFAAESETNQAIARSALAKALRWAERFTESADMARSGYECSPDTPIRVQLASQEANAAALLGDAGRARKALRRAERAAETVTGDSGISAWSFPAGRQAIFALSVAIETGDPDAALRAAAKADAAWSAGDAMALANWAQIRVGAGIAHLLKGSLDGAVAEVAPVLTLPPERRVSTVTAYMSHLGRRLRKGQLGESKAAVELRRSIREFNMAALPGDDFMENG